MTTTSPTAAALESLPVAWSPADDTFFRVVASLFPPDFTAGAGALLGSYDDEQPETSAVVTLPAATAEQADPAARRVTVQS
jgi:hypothetical protein